MKGVVETVFSAFFPLFFLLFLADDFLFSQGIWDWVHLVSKKKKMCKRGRR